MSILRIELGSGGAVPIHVPATRVITATEFAEHSRTVDVVLPTTEEQGRAAWNEIHTVRDATLEWFQRWKQMVPGGCGCRSDLSERLKTHPPDFSSPEAFWLWGVALHNWVNAKLMARGDTTKRQISIDEARTIWDRPVG